MLGYTLLHVTGVGNMPRKVDYGVGYYDNYDIDEDYDDDYSDNYDYDYEVEENGEFFPSLCLPIKAKLWDA